MAVVSPKTIVITTVSNKQALNKMTITPAMSDSLSDNGSNGGRKRKRLTHLTPEERMMRRKLKNRIAAQTARDRKKARMEELQDAIIALQEENDQLMKENQSLQQRSGVLAQENNKLKERLGAKVPVKQEAESESAEGTGSGPGPRHDALPQHSDDSQSDVLLGLLQQIAETAGIAPDAEDETEAESPAVSAQLEHVEMVGKSEEGQEQQQSGQQIVVGSTATELESLKELIQVDHEYYKPPTTSYSVGAAQSSGAVVPETQTLAVQVPTGHRLSLSSTPTGVPTISLSSQNFDQGVNASITSETCAMDTDKFSLADLPTIADSLSELVDLDSFLQADLNSDPSAAALSVSQPTLPELLTAPGKTFVSQDEPVAKKARTLPQEPKRFAPSPNQVVSPGIFDFDMYHQGLLPNAESGYHSDLNDVPSSPGSDISNVIDTDIWGESFTELFPSLI